MKTIRVALVGCGFVSELHMHAYKRVYGVPVSVEAVAAPGDRVVEFAKRHRIPIIGVIHAHHWIDPQGRIQGHLDLNGGLIRQEGRVG